MSKIRPLNALGRRDLLASAKTSPEELRAYGQSYFKEEAYYEALRFFERAKDAEGLADCKKVAIETGDHELLWLLAHCPLSAVAPDDWRACARRALELGKPSVARHIYQRLDDAEGLASVPADDVGSPESLSRDLTRPPAGAPPRRP